MSSVMTITSRPGISASASFIMVVTLVAGAGCCDEAGTSAATPMIAVNDAAQANVRTGRVMIASSAFYVAVVEAWQKSEAAPTRSIRRSAHHVTPDRAETARLHTPS